MNNKKTIDEFLKIKLLELKKLIQSIRYFGLFSPLIRYWILSWIVYTFAYPVVRLALQKEKSIVFCDSLLKIPSKPGVFSFPNIMKSRLVIKEKVDWDVFIEVYLKDVYGKEILKKDLTVVDIGAHIGLYAVLAAEKVGNAGRVIAVEPAPKNYQRLRENILINNFSNVTGINMALSDHTGLEKLYIASLSICNSLNPDVVPSQKSATSYVEVKVGTLDDLLKNVNIKKIDVLKIDAEGAELQILKGAQETLKNNPNLKIVVASYHYPDEVKEVQNFLEKREFKTNSSYCDIISTTEKNVMENTSKYLKKNTPSLLQRAGRWLRIKFAEFEKLIRSVKHLGLFSTLVKFRALELLVHTMVYPVVRITLGREHASNICKLLIKTPSLTVFPFPRPLKSKLLIKDNGGWSVVMEMFINDVYQKDTIKEGMNIIDIGAHIGGHTMYFAEKVGDTGEVIAIEPEPKNYQELLGNIHLNNFKNIIPLQVALSDHNSIEKLYISPSSTGHSLLSELAKNSKTSPFIEVQIKTLDRLIEELHLKKIDIIKIDAEGAEMPILKGAEKTLKNNPHVKILVASYHYLSEIQEVQDFLQNMGFKTKVSPFDIVITI